MKKKSLLALLMMLMLIVALFVIWVYISYLRKKLTAYSGAKDLLTLAVMAGGAYPHRLGLSETVLIFERYVEIG